MFKMNILVLWCSSFHHGFFLLCEQVIVPPPFFLDIFQHLVMFVLLISQTSHQMNQQNNEPRTKKTVISKQIVLSLLTHWLFFWICCFFETLSLSFFPLSTHRSLELWTSNKTESINNGVVRARNKADVRTWEACDGGTGGRKNL